MSPNELIPPLQFSVLQYFAGERREMLMILAAGAVMAALAVALWLAGPSSFAAGFGVTAVLGALLLSATAGSLLIRDTSLSRNLIQGIESIEPLQAIHAERERVGSIVSKYRYYRFGAAIFAAIAVLGLLLSIRPWIHGVAAGLLLLVVVQLVVDYYSERRAGVYLARLDAAVTHAAG
jgi:hypothetical protein